MCARVLRNKYACVHFYNRCPKEFLYLYREFGGNMRIRDKMDRLASQLTHKAPCSTLIRQLEGG